LAAEVVPPSRELGWVCINPDLTLLDVVFCVTESISLTFQKL